VTGPRSIHYRRRWFYGLWVGLLLLCLWAWALWERPRAVDQAGLVVAVQIRNAPAGTQVQAWAGPWARWPGLAWTGDGGARTALAAQGATTLPELRIPIARRRWVPDYIPRGTWDLAMLKFTAPGEPPRYFPLPLSQDIRVGLLRGKHKLTTAITLPWANLPVDGKAPDRIP